MFRTRVLALIWLFLEVATPFSWDMVLSGDKTLEFYDNGTLTHKQEIPEATSIYSIAYDPVHDRVLICDHVDPNATISSYDIKTKEIQYLFTKETDRFNRSTIDYDPVTQLVFLRGARSIWSFSVNPASSTRAREGIRVVTMKHFCYDIAVDSKGGYIYWITTYEIERIRFDGSERQLILRSSVLFRLSLAIDSETQTMYWIEHKDLLIPKTIERANLLGENRETFYTITNSSLASSLAITKDFFYWQDAKEVGTWQLPRNPSEQVARLLEVNNEDCWPCQRVAAKYTV